MINWKYQGDEVSAYFAWVNKLKCTKSLPLRHQRLQQALVQRPDQHLRPWWQLRLPRHLQAQYSAPKYSCSLNESYWSGHFLLCALHCHKAISIQQEQRKAKWVFVTYIVDTSSKSFANKLSEAIFVRVAPIEFQFCLVTKCTVKTGKAPVIFA